jgi:glycosyltransferase involved in cell wall biosynthesis
MRILMTTDTVGGVWSYALELCAALAGEGCEVTLATMGAPLRAGQRDELAAAGLEDVRTSAYALEWMPDPWDDVERAGRWLLRIADEVEPDLVHLNGYAHGALPWGVPVVAVAHSDVLSWHEAVRGRPAGPEWARYRDAVGAGLAGASLLVAPTRATLDAMRRHLDLPCPTCVVPNGTRRTPPRGPKLDVVLTAGRVWDEAKNLAALADVAPALHWPVAVAGDGDVPGPLLRLGRLDRSAMDRALGRAAVFAGPARYEPFGLAALVAGRAGCALVLGDIPTLREVWGDAAIYVPPDDRTALAGALTRLIEDRALRAAWAVRARRRSLEYSAERMAAAYLAIYARVRHTAGVAA